MRSSSPFIASAVSAMTGMCRVLSSALRRPVARRPSIPGSWMSIRMSAGCSEHARASPLSASVALSTVCPTDSSRKVASVMFAGLSSTTSTFAISGHQLAIRHCPADFERKPVAVEIRLFQNRRYEAVQLVPIFGGDRLGCNDQNRNGRRSGIFMERVDDVEPAYVGHQKVEHDQVREIALRHLDCIAAAVRARHRARHTLDVERDQLHRPGVVVDDQNAQALARLDGDEAELDQGIVQLLTRDRLLHHRRGAKREALVAIRDYGD